MDDGQRIAYVGVPDRGVLKLVPGKAPHWLKHLAYHSPTGFSWGYGGSGPADLALALLADHLAENRGIKDGAKCWLPPHDRQIGRLRAWRLHHFFKVDVLVDIALPEDMWYLDADDIEQWLQNGGPEWERNDDRLRRDRDPGKKDTSDGQANNGTCGGCPCT